MTIETILSLEKAAMERWRNGDPWGFVEICADDICYINPGLIKPILNLDEFKKFREPQRGTVHYQISEFIEPKVVLAGDAALLTYNYRSAETNPDGSIKTQTLWNTTEVYFRREGQWKIVHTHWSYVKQKLPEALEIPLPVALTPVKYEGVLGELMALESEAMRRWRTGDPSGYLEIYAPDVTYFDVGSEHRTNGRDAMSAMYKQLAGQIFYEVMDFVDPRVQVGGELAVLFYRFLSTRLNLDGSVSKRTPWNCTEIYRKIDGEWRIIHNHWSFINGVKL
jgi:uncharacterized protein (TIGR02246 family)